VKLNELNSREINTCILIGYGYTMRNRKKLERELKQRNRQRGRDYYRATTEVNVTYYPKGRKKRKVKIEVVINYKDEYQSKEWKIRRKQIKTRDGFKCVNCSCPHNLQVHHTIYREGFHIWEYEDQYLKTLCETCHQKEHDSRPLSSFFNKDLKLTKFTLKLK
jgi:5-methylcytosine-specific restriction endonuclease McrA